MCIAGVMAMTLPAGAATDEKDYDPSIRKEMRSVRAPERRREKELKKQQEQERLAQGGKNAKGIVGDDPWANTPEVDYSNEADEERRLLLDELLSTDFTIEKYEIDYEEEIAKPLEWKDEPICNNVDSLRNCLTEVRNGGTTMLVPAGVSLANDANGIFFCFENGKNLGNLKLRVQYYADDPLNYVDLLFTIDGFEYKFHPAKPSRGKVGGRMYWEQSEDVLTAEDKNLVYALAHCHWARLKFKGSDGMTHSKMLTQKQINAFGAALELYRALGGGFY
ncbi:MAG: hypothetical protein MJZ74_09200 [Muribaculaceae bacterium]|nr:hypothetical protein [Muribaculaceae bacterium]